MKRLVFLSFLMVSVIGFSQINDIKHFPQPVSAGKFKASHLLYKDNAYYMFYYDSLSQLDTGSTTLMFSKSTDGIAWSSGINLSPYFRFDHTILELTACTFQNKLVVFFKGDRGFNYMVHSENGTDWTNMERIYLKDDLSDINADNFSSSSDADSIYFTCTSGFDFTIVSSTNLVNWKIKPLGFLQLGKKISMLPFENNKKVLFYESKNEDGKIYRRTYQGYVPSAPVSILPATHKAYFPRVVKTTDGVIWLAYNTKAAAGAGSPVYDIYYIKSTNNMLTWSEPAQFTSYIGFDSLRSLATVDNLPLVSFFSTRNNLYNHNSNLSLFYGILSQSIENSNAPAILSIQNEVTNSSGSLALNIRAELDGLIASDIKYIRYTVNSGLPDSLTLYDDGAHNDSAANDKIYGNSFGIQVFQKIDFSVNIKRGNLIGRSGIFTKLIFFPSTGSTFNIEINKIKLPVNNVGVLADVNIPQIGTLGKYDESAFLFSGGFLLSGYKNNILWGNGQATASLILNYIPGPVGNDAHDPRNVVYHVYQSDPPFSTSWQEWKYAVELGADFYDGNSDGVYSPVDLNANGLWDTNEDKPFIIGDLVTWCVYNDGQPAILRDRFQGQEPQQIEIQQSIFGSHTNDQKTNNVLFIRYKIINKNLAYQKLSNAYFTFWTDPDIGDHIDDLVGCDTLLSSGMCYNSDTDSRYGNNPPAFFIQLLQGPKAYIPGVTFVDNNSNGVFDETIDTPLDTAVAKLGRDLGIKEYTGARNQDINSFIHFQKSDPILGDPNTVIELRNYQEGKNKIGEILDPCTLNLGNVTGGVDCSLVNPAFWYSGDPVTNVGWINIRPTDQRMMLTTGLFDIEYGKDVEIIVAYIIGRGTSALNSITAAREIAQFSKQVYNTNFINLPLIVEDNNLVSDYNLFQNYPNPFNPSTNIRYSIGGVNGSMHNISLKVFDLLGRELAVLVNESKTAGSYEVNFNSSDYNLSSGVYFYRLQVDAFTSVRKMMVIK